MRRLIVLGFVGLRAQLIDGSLGDGVGGMADLLDAADRRGGRPCSRPCCRLGCRPLLGDRHLARLRRASHHRLGNVDSRTVSILAVPGFVGAFIGATALSNLDAAVAKPIVTTILLSLGIYVSYRFLPFGGRRPQFKPRPSVGFLAPASSSRSAARASTDQLHDPSRSRRRPWDLGGCDCRRPLRGLDLGHRVGRQAGAVDACPLRRRRPGAGVSLTRADAKVERRGRHL